MKECIIIDFVKKLKQALIQNNLENVKLIGSDQCCGAQWTIADEMLVDQELMNAVDVIGDHYIETNFDYKSTPAARKQANRYGITKAVHEKGELG